MKSMVREYAKGAVIFNEGDVGNTAYIISEGAVEISVQIGSKKSILTVVNPVSVFGEMALLMKDQKRTATAVAKCPSKVAEITRRDFDDIISQSPRLVSVMLSALVERLQRTTAMVVQTPDLFLAVGEILNLLAMHTSPAIRYDTAAAMIKYEPVVKSLAAALLIDLKEVQKTLQVMETLGLIAIKVENNQKYIDVPHRDDFLERCKKVHKTLAQIGVSDEL
ncbi:MAG: cyclic nucleotide-binding domain-containing protein [Candidatus Riflebacteria bacterium]|nr:cyclic nucleotide-binding domain-containing protein [Candidatus Riflebacteria bacterium]